MSEVEQDIEVNSDVLSDTFPEEPPKQLMMPKRALTGPTGAKEVRGLQEQQLRQGQLLLVSLLENFCSLYEQSPERNSQLFLEICKRLSSLGIIKSSDILDEMASVRSTYKRAFKELVVTALKEIKSERKLSERNALLIKSPVTTDDEEEIETVHRMASLMVKKGKYMASHSRSWILESSRYGDEFLEICPLGAGAFGQVWKAKNKLDALEYAVKKVRLKNASSAGFEKILREVKYLARLSHPNVVRFYSSWIEHAFWSPFPRPTNNASFSASYESFTKSASQTFDKTSIVSEESSTHFTSTVMVRSESQESLPLNLNRELVLFIQMEICGLTLSDWIKKRNENLNGNVEYVNIDEAHSAFLDILYGLEYIHSKGCIHRDLKPQNIYQHIHNLERPDASPPGHWKLGDFGLATTTDREDVFVFESSVAESQTLGIGTITYASPEQLSDQLDTTYTTQSDIYSVGIIFFELLHPFSTGMERARLLTDLRQGVMPDSFVKRFPKEAALILWLMSDDPENRPTASQLVDFELLRVGKSQCRGVPVRQPSSDCMVEPVDSNLFSKSGRIQELEAENVTLRERIEELEAENVTLRERIEELEAENVTLRERIEDSAR